MTYEEFQRHLGRAGLTIGGFATLVKMNPNSVTNYAKGGLVPSHLAIIAALLSEMGENQIDYIEPLERIDIEPKKPRGRAGIGTFGGSRQTDLPLEHSGV